MPNYTYVCNKCDEEFNKVTTISERKQLQDCPHCGAKFSGEQNPNGSKAPGFKVRGGTQKFYG